jgi:hypothetical protein
MIESYNMVLNYLSINKTPNTNEAEIVDDMFPNGLKIKNCDNKTLVLKANVPNKNNELDPELGLRIMFYPIKVKNLESVLANLAKEIASGKVIRGTSEVFEIN